MSKIKAIATGFANVITKSDEGVEALAAHRLSICQSCSAYRYSKAWRTEVCSTSVKMIHKNSGKIVSGCGCVISAKVRQSEEPCPSGKWE